MAAHLKAVLRQQKGIAGETKAKVDKLRQFIAEQTERLVQEADNMDADDTKLIDEHARTEGPHRAHTGARSPIREAAQYSSRSQSGRCNPFQKFLSFSKASNFRMRKFISFPWKR